MRSCHSLDIIIMKHLLIGKVKYMNQIALLTPVCSLMDVILNLFRMMKGDYTSLRKSHNLTKYDEDEIFALFQEAGFSPELHSNIGLNKDRYCVVSSINRKSL